MTGAPRWLRVLEHQALVYRRTWRGSLFTSFLVPVLFLTAMGIGLGSYVDRSGTDIFGGVSYLAFLAPGLLGGALMQTASFESTYPVLNGLQWSKTFGAMTYTPVRTRDVVVGHLAWMAVRLTLVGGVFLLVMFAFGAATSPAALLVVPAGVLTGLAFAAPITAFSATQRNDNRFAMLFRFGLTPLFLFSGTFFPVSQLPDLIEPLAWVTPLFHGVSLARGLSLGGIDPLLAVVHVAVLATFVAVGAAWAMRTFRRRLAS